MIMIRIISKCLSSNFQTGQFYLLVMGNFREYQVKCLANATLWHRIHVWIRIRIPFFQRFKSGRKMKLLFTFLLLSHQLSALIHGTLLIKLVFSETGSPTSTTEFFHNKVLRPLYNMSQWLIWNVSINVCVISHQLGLQPIFGANCLVY